MRPIVLGRKDRLFCDIRAGAYASLVAFTLLETAKANGSEPEAWLKTYGPSCRIILPDPEATSGDLLPWTADMRAQDLCTADRSRIVCLRRHGLALELDGELFRLLDRSVKAMPPQ